MKHRKTGLQLLEEIEQAKNDHERWRTLVSTLEEWRFPNVATEDQLERSTVELRTDLRETESRLQQEMAKIKLDLRETEARLQKDLRETEVRLQKSIHRQTFILVGLIGLLMTLFKFAAGGLPF